MESRQLQKICISYGAKKQEVATWTKQEMVDFIEKQRSAFEGIPVHMYDSIISKMPRKEQLSTSLILQDRPTVRQALERGNRPCRLDCEVAGHKWSYDVKDFPSFETFEETFSNALRFFLLGGLYYLPNRDVKEMKFCLHNGHGGEVTFRTVRDWDFGKIIMISFSKLMEFNILLTSTQGFTEDLNDHYPEDPKWVVRRYALTYVQTKKPVTELLQVMQAARVIRYLRFPKAGEPASVDAEERKPDPKKLKMVEDAWQKLIDEMTQEDFPPIAPISIPGLRPGSALFEPNATFVFKKKMFNGLDGFEFSKTFLEYEYE